jgi:hypothetical protein
VDGKFTPLDGVMTWIERGAQRYQKVDVAILAVRALPLRRLNREEGNNDDGDHAK